MDTGKTSDYGQTIRNQSREKVQFENYNPRNLDENTFHENPEQESNVGGFDSEREENRNADNNVDDRKADDDDALQHDDYSDIESQDDDFHDNRQRSSVTD